MPFYHSFFHFCLQSLVFTTRWVHSLILINNFKPGIFQQKRTFFCNVVSNVSNQSTFSTSIIIAMCLLSKVSQFCQYMIRWNYPKDCCYWNSCPTFFICSFFSIFVFILQKGNLLNEVPLNSTYWAPVDAHDPIRVQQIMLGLSKIPAEKMDLALARDTKICECQ